MPRDHAFRTFVRDVMATYGASWLWVVFLTNALRGIVRSAESSLDTMPMLGVIMSWLPHIPVTSAFLSQNKGFAVVTVLVFAPLLEEAFFRYHMLTWARHYSARMVRATLLVCCGLTFGILHGSILNVFLQGVIGLFFGLLYLKYANQPFKAYFSSVLVHSMYNFTVLMAG